MVCPPADGHPSKYKPGPILIFIDQDKYVNHYTKPPTLSFIPMSTNVINTYRIQRVYAPAMVSLSRVR